MSCWSVGRCCKSTETADFAKEVQEEAIYQPLKHSEGSYVSEAIPLLPQSSTMIKYEADPLQYEIISLLGKGMQGSVTISHAKHLKSGNHVTIRSTDLETIQDISYVQQEVLVSRQLRHENLLPYLCSFVNHNELWVIMPLIKYGSTKDIMKNNYPTGLPELAIALILRDVLSGLDYLHCRGFIHRSIKASHILINGRGRAMLTGLRYSCSVIKNCRWYSTIHCFPQDSISNLNWLSPELLEQNLLGYSFKSDLYSIGILACELANGFEPFVDLCPTQMILEKLQGYTPQPIDARCYEEIAEELPHIQEISSYQQRLFSETFHYFTQLCLQKDPIHRPSASQLQCHAFIKQCKKNSLNLLQLLVYASPIDEIKLLTPPDIQDLNNEATNKLKDISLDQPIWNF